MRHRKIWMKLFGNIALVFMVLSFVIALSNVLFLDDFFVWREKTILARCADSIEGIRLDDRDQAVLTLEAIEDKHSIEIKIYESDRLVYSTLRHSGRPGMTGFDLLLEGGMISRPSNFREFDGGYFGSAAEGKNQLYVYYRTRNDYSIVLSVQQAVVSSGANTANMFMVFVACTCMVFSLLWSIAFSRRFSRPIMQMNEIAVNMSKLDFSRKLEIDSKDEIGELASSINNLSSSLDAALKELNEKNAALRDEIELERRLDGMRKGFVASVSHELKTPISIIHGYAELLENSAGDGVCHTDYCNIIMNETDRMNRLVMNLLELSKIESGLKPNYTEFDLVPVILGQVDACTVRIDEKKVTTQLRLPDRLEVRSDELLVGQIIQNYLSNAISHVNAGGEIRIFTEPYKGNIRLCVFNTGSAVSTDEMESIWQSFYRSDKSHNRSEGRYGLGLSIVRACMVALDCDFGVYNIDDGVCFWAEIPPSAAND